MGITIVGSPFASTVALSDMADGQYLKDNYLTGFIFKGVDDQELAPEWFRQQIATALAKFETITAFDVQQRVITDEGHDYYVDDYMNFAYLQLFRFPTQSVQQVRAIYPTGQEIQIFPTEWVRLEAYSSQLHLVPTAGTIGQVLIGMGNGFTPFIFGGVGYLPQLWHIDYTTGFPPDAVPLDVVDAVMKYAAIEILQTMSDLVGPIGVTSSSLSIDGMSQSLGRQIPAFKAKIDAYRRDLGLDNPNYTGGMIAQLRRTYAGVMAKAL